MNLVTLAQSLLILRNLNLKPRKYKLEDLTLAIATYLLGVQVTKLGIPPSTLYYYKKLGIRRKEERPTCPSCNSNKIITDRLEEKQSTSVKRAEKRFTTLITSWTRNKKKES